MFYLNKLTGKEDFYNHLPLGQEFAATKLRVCRNVPMYGKIDLQPDANLPLIVMFTYLPGS
jgi:hypothetical protein